MSLQLIENKALSRGIIGKSAPTLAEITIRKSQPPEWRKQVARYIDMELKKQKWDKAFIAFAEAIVNYKNSQTEPAFFVVEAIYRILEKVDIDGSNLLCIFAEIRNVVSSYIKIIKQEHGSDLDESKIEVMAEKEAAEEINLILKQANIHPEVYWSSIDIAKENNIYKRIGKAFTNGFLHDEELLDILSIPVIRLIGKRSSQEITPLIESFRSQKKDKHKLSPSMRIFCESLRQQLSKPCGIVCPYAYKRQGCCGKKELLQRMHERLPETVKSNYEVPNCNRIRQTDFQSAPRCRNCSRTASI